MERKIYIKPQVKNILFYIFQVLLLISFFVWAFESKDDNSIIINYKFVMPYWIFAFFITELVGMLYIKKIDYYDFGLWFVILSNLFMFGKIVADFFMMESNIYDPEFFYTEAIMFESLVYIVICINMFSLGYSCFYNKKGYQAKKISNIPADQRVFICGTILFIIGGIFKIYSDWKTITFMQSVNTYTEFSEYSTSGIVYSLGSLFVTGICFIVCSGKLGSKKKFTLIIVSVTYLIITMILTGSRKVQIFQILAIVLCMISTSKKKLNIKKTLVISVCSLVFLDIIYIIRDFRTDIAQIPTKFIESLVNLKFLNNIIAETLNEFGLIIYSVANMMICVPNIFPYQYGLTFFRTFFSFLPIGGVVGDFFNEASSTFVINKYLDMPAGSSLFGDFYWNFGFIGGIFCSFILGVGIFKFLSRLRKKGKRSYFAYYFSLFSILMMTVRASFSDIWRTFIYFLILTWIIDKFIYNLLYKKNAGKG